MKCYGPHKNFSTISSKASTRHRSRYSPSVSDCACLVRHGKKKLLNDLSENTALVINSGLIWQHEKNVKIRSVMAMKNDVTEREVEGLRLLTKQELYDLIEIFDLHQNGTINMDLEGSYWLTDSGGNPVIGAWERGDQCDPSRTYFPHKRGYIRLVRKQ